VTPKAGKGTGMVEKAAELAEKHGWFLCHQFETEANWQVRLALLAPQKLDRAPKRRSLTRSADGDGAPSCSTRSFTTTPRGPKSATT